MAPHSPGTDQIDTLLLIGFVAATILVVAVVGGLLYALRRYRDERGAEPRQVSGGRGIQLRVGGALGAFAAVLLVLGIVYTDKARETPATGAAGLKVAHAEPLKIDGHRPAVAVALRIPQRSLLLLQARRPGRHRGRARPRLDRRRPHLGRARPRRQARRRARQDQPRRLQRRRRRDLSRPVGDALRPGLRGDADRGRSRLTRTSTKPSSMNRRPQSRTPRTASSV